VNVEVSSSKIDEGLRNQQYMELEKEVNEELQEIFNRDANKGSSTEGLKNQLVTLEKEMNDDLQDAIRDANKSPVLQEDDQNSNDAEFVDATQLNNNESEDDCEKAAGISQNEVNSQETFEPLMHEVVQKDIQFLKNSWANLDDMEPVVDDVLNAEPASDLAQPSLNGLSCKLPFNVSARKADDIIPAIDDQGFQIVTCKSTKKAVKKAYNLKKSHTYPIRNRTGSSKPFR